MVMKLKFVRAGVVLAATVTLAASAGAAVIGPWPAASSYLWETQPIPGYTSGVVSIVAPDVLQTPSTSGQAKTTWVPYPANPGERLTIARLILPVGQPALSIHTKVYDPYTTGKSGWAVILRDNSATQKWLHFGIMGWVASKQIIPRQYDGSAWTLTPVMTRASINPTYYTMDFGRNPDNTLYWKITANYSGADQWTQTGNTAITYGDITEVYLSAATSDTTVVNYKWTEFGVIVPEPMGLLALASGLLGMAGLAIRRRM